MKALTVQQPWAWAIIHGGKDVENRTQDWSYRGTLAIHAGARWSERGPTSPLVRRAVWDFYGTSSPLVEPRFCSRESPRVFGAIIGVVDMVDAHVSWMPECNCMVPLLDGAGNHSPRCAVFGACCESPWAESSYDEHRGSTTRVRRDVVHLVLENPRPLLVPVPCRGALGVWTVPDDVVAQLGGAVVA